MMRDKPLHIRALFSHLAVTLIKGQVREMQKTLIEIRILRTESNLPPMTDVQMCRHALGLIVDYLN